MIVSVARARARNYQRASSLYEEAADSWENIGNSRRSLFCRARALENSAKHFKEIEEYEEFGKKMLEASKYWDMLNDNKNAAWCLANFHVNQAIDYSSKELRYEAITEYEFAKKLFHQINDKISTVWCKAQILVCKGIIKGSDGMYYEKSFLLQEASLLFKNLRMFEDALNIEADGLSAFGLHKKGIYEYEDAKRFFQIASKKYKRASNEISFFWCLGHMKKCEYFILKENFVFDRDIDRLLRTLRDGMDYYKKSKDLVQLLFLEGDFHKYLGLKMKRENKFPDAIEEFSKAEESYSKLTEMFPERKYFYEKSMLYAKALKIGTIADMSFMELKFKEALVLYQEAYNLFSQCEDYESAKIYENFRTLCQTMNYIIEGRIEEAIKLQERLPSNISSIIPKRVSFIQMTTFTKKLMKLMLKQNEEIARTRVHYRKTLEDYKILVDSFEEEPKYQDFLTRTPNILNPTVKQTFPKCPLAGELIPDFLLILHDSTHVFVEIEKPAKKIFNKDGNESAAYTSAFGQVRGFVTWASENLDFLRKRMCPNITSSNIRGMLVIGHNNDLTEDNNKSLERINYELGVFYEVKTFDQLYLDRLSNLENIG